MVSCSVTHQCRVSSSSPTQELQCLPRYPSEILPLFLYLGDRQQAFNASVNHDLKIHAHLSIGAGLQSAYPGKISELHFDIEDKPDEDLFSRFEEIFEFLGIYIP